MDDGPYEQGLYPLFGDWDDYSHYPGYKPDKSPMFFGRVDEPIIAFTNSSNNDIPTDVFGDGSNGMINKELEWSNSANNWDGESRETATTLNLSLRLDPSGDIEADTVDVTPRRLQALNCEPADELYYEITGVVSGALQGSGYLNADAHGLITVPQVALTKSGVRLLIEKTGTTADVNCDGNIDLEDLVIERTKDLKVQSEELEAKNSELTHMQNHMGVKNQF